MEELIEQRLAIIPGSIEIQPSEIDTIKKQIKELRNKKNMIQKKEREKGTPEDKKLRLKSNNNGKSNTLSRISNSMATEFTDINDKREENGLDALSIPKITDLIRRHKSWNKIKRDLVNFNTALDLDEEDEFNDK